MSPPPSSRTEHDALGPIEVPLDAPWGPQTQRALQATPVSGRPMPPRLIRALARIKRACALSNAELGRLDEARARAIAAAAGRVVEGELQEAFPVDVFQTGSGTATNMNMNEVLARLAAEYCGEPVHPNDHVNQGQSSNDVFPSALHLAGALALHQELLPALVLLEDALLGKARAWDGILKSGRTHLMDATPLRLGQEVGGWAAQLGQGRRRATAARDALLELALGGTAVGTGINRHPELPARVIARLQQETGLPFREAADHFEAQGARDGIVEAQGQLDTLATSLFKIASDIRLLSSGPRTGLGELVLPPLAPGSSIMPGKVNPVMCEMLTQVCVRVIGHGATVRMAAMAGQLQLNVFMPVMAEAFLDSVVLLARGAELFATRAVLGMQADAARCRASLERNLALGTALAPALGYDRVSALAKEAWASDRGLRELVLEQGLLPEAELDRLLDPFTMTQPG